MAGRTFYQLHALRAAAGYGFGALRGWLDHVQSMGCGGVLLTPIHASADHGYDTLDAFRLDPRLGDDADFDAFVSSCHDRDLRLVLDGVFNHVGRDHPEPTAGFFRRDDDGAPHPWEGHGELVEVDHDHPAVLEWAAAAANHWLDRGVDGWRLDVAYSIPPPFLRALAERITSAHPDALVFGEMIHGDYAGFVDASGLHSATAYELHNAIWSSLHDRNPHELAWTLQRHAEAALRFSPVTFVGNHDVTRIASLVASPASQVPVALAVLFTVPGIPCIYYGDEFGTTGVKEDRAGGDDAIRPSLGDLRPFADVSGALTDLHRHFITWRRDRPWLTEAVLEVGEVTNDALHYAVGAGPHRVDVMIRPDSYNITESE